MAMASMSDSEKYVEPLVDLMTNLYLQKAYFELGIESIKLSDLKENKLVTKIFETHSLVNKINLILPQAYRRHLNWL